jgi:RhtB (resistance to homoserine/threonine) family protein
MGFWSQFLAVTAIGCLAVISPGPDFVIVTRNSLLYSKKVGLCTALGIVVGNIWWITSSLVGISYLISQMVVLYSIIKFAGAIYLIYLGIRSLLAKKPSAEDGDAPAAGRQSELTARQAFRIGLFTNLLNPKCALFFVSFFSVILTSRTPFVLRAFYGIEVAAFALVWFSALATVLSISRVKQVFGRISIWVERITGASLITLGVKLALSRSD